MSKSKKKRFKKYQPKYASSKAHMAVVNNLWLANVEAFFERVLSLGDVYTHQGRVLIKRIGEDDFDPADTVMVFVRDVIHVANSRLKTNLDLKPLNRLVNALEKRLTLTHDMVKDAFECFNKGKILLSRVNLQECIDYMQTAQIKYYIQNN